jgi:hypothetical protein
MFANLNGTISAWDTDATPHIEATTSGAVYTGLAISHDGTQLYAANDAGSGSIDVFNSSWGRVTTNGFATPGAISSRGLVPFNVQDINGQVYVTYAPAGRSAQATATPGQGAVAIFNEAGVLQSIVINSPTSALAAPWGIALAPAGFGEFGGDLLVGNFSFVDSDQRLQPHDRGVSWHNPSRPRQRADSRRPLVTQFWDRRQQRRPRHPLHHRRDRWRDARAIRRHRPRPRTVGACSAGDCACVVWCPSRPLASSRLSAVTVPIVGSSRRRRS